jgi:hypothetical protein
VKAVVKKETTIKADQAAMKNCKPFHVECFACYRHPNLLTGEAKLIMDSLEQAYGEEKRFDKRYHKDGRKTEYIKDVSEIELPMDTPEKPLRKWRCGKKRKSDNTETEGGDGDAIDDAIENV